MHCCILRTPLASHTNLTKHAWSLAGTCGSGCDPHPSPFETPSKQKGMGFDIELTLDVFNTSR